MNLKERLIERSQTSEEVIGVELLDRFRPRLFRQLQRAIEEKEGKAFPEIDPDRLREILDIILQFILALLSAFGGLE